ncbi:MAG: hypothetical protein GY838_00575, partial [bacterium]|nr:hypothetical protein [bacterium]
DTMTGELILGSGLSCVGCVDEADLADGVVTEVKLSFDPATQAELDEQRLHEVSGGVLSNEYDLSESETTRTSIPDNTPVPVSVSMTRSGSMLEAGTQVKIRHAWLDTLDISLTFTPNDVMVPPVTIQLAEADPAAICDFTGTICGVPTDCATPAGPCVERTYDWPNTDVVVSGSFDDLVGLNPSGTWVLTVTDTCETWPPDCPVGNQYIEEFRLSYRLLNDASATVNGDFGVDETLMVYGSLFAEDDLYVTGTSTMADLSATGGSFSGDLNMNNNLVTNIGAAGSDFTSGGGLNIAGDLQATGTSTIADLSATGGSFSGDLYANSNFEVDGNTTLGDSASDTVTFNAVAASDLNMNNNPVTNIGAAGTDFTSGGGLNIAGDLQVTGTINNAGGRVLNTWFRRTNATRQTIDSTTPVAVTGLSQ